MTTNYGINPLYQNVFNRQGKFFPLAKEFREISRNMSGNAVRIYIELIHHTKFPSQRTLSKTLNIEIRSVTRALKELCGHGLLLCEGRDKTTSKYSLDLDRDNWSVCKNAYSSKLEENLCANLTTDCVQFRLQIIGKLCAKTTTEHRSLLIIKKEEKNKKGEIEEGLAELARKFGLS